MYLPVFKCSDFKIIIVSLLIWIFLGFQAYSTGTDPIRFPFFFSKNKGQYNSEVNYTLKTNKANVFFGKAMISYQFVQHNETLKQCKVENLQFNFLGAKKNHSFIESDQLGSFTNYLLGKDSGSWIRNIPNFQTLEYGNLYSNIDLKYYGRGNALKYDFVVHPGGKPEDINIQVEGAKSIKIISDDQIELQTESRTLVENIPEAYQLIKGVHRKISIKYILKNGVISFALGDYDKSVDLIIDPLMIYSTFIGGSGDDLIVFGNMQKDATGNIYTSGYTSSTNFPTEAGSYDVSYNGGNYDAFVFKLNSSGSALIYSTFFGGTEFDRAYDILLEPGTNNLFVVGETWSPGFPVTAGAYQTVHASPTGVGADCFVLKLNQAGNSIIFSTLCGGGNDDKAGGIEFNSSNDLVVAGQIQSPDFPVTAGSYDVSHNGDFDVAVMIFSNDGSSLLRSTFLGGALREGATSVIVGTNDEIYVATHTQGSFPITAGALDNTYNGGVYDMAISKLDATLTTLIYSTYIGGSGDDWIRNDLHLDNSGNLLFSGAASPGFPSTTGSYDASHNGGASDVFIAELNNTGTALNFSTFIGSSGDDGSYKCYRNAQNNIVVTGYCAVNYPVTPCCYDDSYNGGTSDAFISIFNSTASNLLYSTYIGGAGADKGTFIICESDTAYVVGETSSADFPVTAGSYDQSYNGGAADIIAFKLYLGFQPPLANFTTITTPCGLIVPFTNSSVNAVSYEWHFGDGTTSVLVNPTHTYITAGTYTVLLIANPGTSCADSNEVIVNPGGMSPQAQFTLANTSCTFDITTTNTSLNSTAYNWNFGDGGTSSLVAPSHTYTLPGTYTISLVAQAGASCFDTLMQSITILPNTPAADFVSAATVCAGTISFANTSFNAQNYSWDFGDGSATSTIAAPAHSYSVPGTYLIQLIATNTVCNTSDTIVRNITILATPTVSLPADTIICSQQNLQLSVVSGGNTVLWNTGSTSSGITVTQSGTYWVMLSNGFCNDRDTIDIEFFTSPDLGPDQTACVGNPISLDVSALSGTYSWSNGSVSPVTVVNSSGIYWVEVVSGTCISRDSVNVLFVPVPVVNIGNDTSFCAEEFLSSIVLNAGTIPSATYQWSSGATTQAIPVNSLGTYWVEVDNGYCASTDTIHITQYGGIELGESRRLCAVEDIKLIPVLERNAQATYLWSTGETNPSITVSGPGMYWVAVSQGSCLFTDSVEVIGSISEGALYVPNTFTPGPDYLNDVFYAEGESIVTFNMKIFDRWGTLIFESNKQSEGWDGSYKGRVVQADTYVWVVDYATDCNDMTAMRKTGVVNVVR